jgi:hypothetical protein
MLQSQKDSRAIAYRILAQADFWQNNKTRRHSSTVKIIKRLIKKYQL